jgi:hypothetical protein
MMLQEKHVWLYQECTAGERALRTFVVEDIDATGTSGRRNLQFRISGPIQRELCNLNSAAAGLVYSAMHEGRKLVLHGPVSRRLLENLEEFQLAWAAWMPKSYRPIEIRAEREIHDERLDPVQRAIAAFSGGVDASFTVWRHHTKSPGRYHKNLTAVMLVQGFDIPLSQNEAFATAKASALAMVEEMDLAFFTMRTNLRQFLPHWSMNFGAGVAACLHQFSSEYAFGLIGSDEPYGELVTPWGSNPITTPLLSGRNFEISYDGTGYTRTDRAAHIAGWQGAMRHLRVCWQGPSTGRNCCSCEKCVRTILNFRASGLPRPIAFEEDVTDDQIRSVEIRNPAQRGLFREIRDTAKRNGIADSWIGALEDLLSSKRPDVKRSRTA